MPGAVDAARFELWERRPADPDPVRGVVGLLVGLELVTPGEGMKPNPGVVQRLLEACLARGLLLYSAGLHSHVIRIFPPLIVNQEQVDEALRILDESLSETIEKL